MMGRTSAAVVDNFQVKIQAPGNFLAVQDFTFQVQQPDAVANKGNFFRLRAVVHAEAHRRFHVDCLMCLVLQRCGKWGRFFGVDTGVCFRPFFSQHGCRQCKSELI